MAGIHRVALLCSRGLFLAGSYTASTVDGIRCYNQLLTLWQHRSSGIDRERVVEDPFPLPPSREGQVLFDALRASDPYHPWASVFIAAGRYSRLHDTVFVLATTPDIAARVMHVLAMHRRPLSESCAVPMLDLAMPSVDYSPPTAHGQVHDHIHDGHLHGSDDHCRCDGLHRDRRVPSGVSLRLIRRRT